MQQVDKENSHKLGLRIKQLRLKKSGSLNSFVLQRGGVTTATWSRLENGMNDFKLSTIIKVAAMLEIPITELLKDIDFECELNE